MSRPSHKRDAARVFAEAGLPYTVQRRAICETLDARTDHPTADDVVALVEERLPGVARTTVYRTLETMVRLGLAEKVGHPGVSVRYDPRTTRHHHLACEQCGAVVDLEDDELDALALPRELPQGFRARTASVLVLGLCASCSDSAD